MQVIFKADEISRWLYIHTLQSSSFLYNSVALWQPSVEHEQTFWIRVLRALSLRPHQVVLRVITGTQPENQELWHKHVYCSSRRYFNFKFKWHAFFLLFDVWGSVSSCVRKNAVVLTLGFERRIAFMSSYNWVISLVFWSRFCSHSSANDGRTKALVLYLHIQCWFLGFITRISLLVAWRNCECLAWKEGLAQYIEIEFMTCMISDVWVSVT